jgi:putative ABC transport system permease protein
LRECDLEGDRSQDVLILETFRVALDALRVNRMRSLLTMLGIVIGIAAVIAMVALGNGAQNSVKERIARLGTTVLQINPQRVMQGGVGTGTQAKLSMQDVQFIRERSPNVLAVNMQQDRPLQVVWRNRNTNVQVTGTAPNFLEVRGFHMATGRMFTQAEDNGRRKLAVLGADVLPLLGVDNGDALIGERIRIAGRAFTVVGVMAARGQTGFGDADEQILIPFQTGRFGTFGTDRINDIWALAISEDSVEAAMAEVQAALRRSHKLRAGRPDDFSIRNQTDFLTALNETTQTFTTLLAGIAAVSLLVGGIGIMNIMLVSVTERTREIGIRKALGATRTNILLQFLTESVVLCLLGGAFGIGAGLVTADQVHRAMGWNTAVDVRTLAIAFGFASATGLLFGVWPARRAATMDPIEALRYE